MATCVCEGWPKIPWDACAPTSDARVLQLRASITHWLILDFGPLPTIEKSRFQRGALEKNFSTVLIFQKWSSRTQSCVGVKFINRSRFLSSEKVNPWFMSGSSESPWAPDRGRIYRVLCPLPHKGHMESSATPSALCHPHLSGTVRLIMYVFFPILHSSFLIKKLV